MATIKKMVDFWNMVMYSIVKVHQRFRGGLCLHEDVNISETSVYIHITRRHISKGCSLLHFILRVSYYCYCKQRLLPKQH
jgi:hypothetical protein